MRAHCIQLFIVCYDVLHTFIYLQHIVGTEFGIGHVKVAGVLVHPLTELCSAIQSTMVEAMTTNDTSGLETSGTTTEEHTNQSTLQSDEPQPQQADTRRPTQIPSLLTNSLRAVLDAFGDKIIQLRAQGSIESTNNTLLENLRDYGLSWQQSDTQRLVLDYEQLPGKEPKSPVNPLAKDAREDLLAEVEARLGPSTAGVDSDLAVTSLTIRVTDDRLEAVTPANTDEFDICLVSDPAEQAIRDVTRRRNVGRGLYDELGFEVRNLNVRSVIETAAKHHQQSDGKYLSWGGPGDIRPRSPERLAVRINDHILPDDNGVLKPYTVTADDTLELADDALDEVDDVALVGGSETPADETGGGA